jgi:hypothetical protein
MIEYCDFDEQHTIRATTIAGCGPTSSSAARRQARRHRREGAARRLPARARGARRSERVRTCSPITRAGAHAHHAAVGEGLRRETCSRARVRRHVPARRDVLQRRARAGSVAHRVRRRAARHPGEPDDADRAAAGGGLRLAAGGDGGERAEDQRARRNLYERSARSAGTSRRSARG